MINTFGFSKKTKSLWLTGLAISSSPPMNVGEAVAAEARLPVLLYLIVLIVFTKLNFRQNFPPTFLCGFSFVNAFWAFWTAKMRKMMIMLLEEPICVFFELLYRSAAIRPRPKCRAPTVCPESPPARQSTSSRTFGDFFPLRSVQPVLAFVHWVSFSRPKQDRIQVWQPPTIFLQPVQPQVRFIYAQLEGPLCPFAMQMLQNHQYRLSFATLGHRMRRPVALSVCCWFFWGL